jgi:hypothetical protein
LVPKVVGIALKLKGIYNTPDSKMAAALKAYKKSLIEAISKEDGDATAALFRLSDPHADDLAKSLSAIPQSSRPFMTNFQTQLFTDLITAHLNAIQAHHQQDIAALYDHQLATLQALLKILPNLSRWCLPILFTICTDLYHVVNRLDEHNRSQGEKANKLEDATRFVNKAFTACITDR